MVKVTVTNFGFVQYSMSNMHEQAVRVATQYAPATLPPVGALAPHVLPSRRNVAVVSHAQCVLTVTAAPVSCVKAAVSKATW